MVNNLGVKSCSQQTAREQKSLHMKIRVLTRTKDMVFRAVGRPGVVLLTEGPLPRVKKLFKTRSLFEGGANE